MLLILRHLSKKRTSDTLSTKGHTRVCSMRASRSGITSPPSSRTSSPTKVCGRSGKGRCQSSTPRIATTKNIMRSPNINTLMPLDKMPFSNCVRTERTDSRANLERRKLRLDVNKIRSCQQLIQRRDLPALTSIFS